MAGKRVIIGWCDNYARGILRCHLARGGTFLYDTMEKEKICSFFGHREIENSQILYAATAVAVMQAVRAGCRVFYFDGDSAFDELCYQIVTKLKCNRPDLSIKRVFCVSRADCLHKKPSNSQHENYEEILFLSPPLSPKNKSIYSRNCAMIDESDFVIFYAKHRLGSGAYKTYQYALKKTEKKVINLG